ncbi:cysteine--tRNA ligase [Candidatus Nucleicultrix amoebiphila]|jgi:cysteinyl-tRNA synthetase|uniref:Cysteine--tRNA ligase n=1 Tax=Candidatus Nucleicultrix amoebiphila FS5 TaxID=1414854 RepID=A0A1W6N6R6_9PROT|nr:cysteine--tRNA ligase [Candidatus Nucleicultrix amoebiphila]ARN85446.1 cysteinyl-tRNA synthetase [Candidatus Nucleicultrix amoebiphila FS5]
MTIILYNTLTQCREELVPITPGEVKMYVCGPTVYDRAHIGNARPYVVFDVLFRLLQIFYKTTYARNITDIEDKIIVASKESGEPISALTERTTRLFHEDMATIGILPPTIEPRATMHIQEMIDIIETLIQKDHAYEAQGHVLFNVKSFKDYGTLSKRNLDDMLAGARVEIAPYKKDPMDFVLWKPSTDDVPGWPSPWGRGRPGWHIECSAMSCKHLGTSFDIHGGGRDLIFPHHENEIAQSQAAFGNNSFARLWMHNGILTVNGEKMSKSLGNFFTVRDLLDQADGETIRLALLSTHYRQPLDWKDTTLAQAKSTLDRFYTALKDYELHEEPSYDEAFIAILQDDLNTPKTLTWLHSLVSDIHAAESSLEKAQMQAILRKNASLLGILQQDPKIWFQKTVQKQAHTLEIPQIEQLILERQSARFNKDFAQADSIRKTLEENGIILEDSPKGTTWRRV